MNAGGMIATKFLRYPQEAVEDTLVIHISRYKPRTKRGDTNLGQGIIGDPAYRDPAIATIKLPVPDLPNMVSQQKYGQISGAFNNVLATGLAQAYDAIADGRADNIDVNSIAATVRAQASDAGGPVLRELTAAVAGNLVGITGPMFQSLASGEISNPNIELLYNGPTLRSYSMNWTFAPKSAEEAENVYEIFRVMKQAHLPSKNGGMLKVPHIFDMEVRLGEGSNKYYQKFFSSALEAISIKQDSSGSHITLPNGAPVISQMSCVFKEIRVTTAEDFEDNI